jgi:hypothetical protein
MSTMTKVQDKADYQLGPKDRCDSCGAEALVQVTGLNGDLMFCGHHYNKIMDNATGYKNMMKFAITIRDERDKLIENKLKDENYV